MTNIRKETDSLGGVEVPADKLGGAQTQRALEHSSIGNVEERSDLILSCARVLHVNGQSTD